MTINPPHQARSLTIKIEGYKDDLETRHSHKSMVTTECGFWFRTNRRHAIRFVRQAQQEPLSAIAPDGVKDTQWIWGRDMGRDRGRRAHT